MSAGSQLFTWLGQSVDSALQAYMGNNVSALCGALTGVAIIAMTIWTLVFAYDTMFGFVEKPLAQFVKKFIMSGMVLAVALGGGLYQYLVVDVAKDLQMSLIQIAANVPGATEPLSAVDKIADKYFTAVESVLMQGGVVGSLWDIDVLRIIIVIMMMGAGIITMVFAGGSLLLVKVAMSVLLGLGPIFILCLLFNQTAKFFDGWLSTLLNYILLSVLLLMICGMMVGLVDYLFKDMGSSSPTLRHAGGFVVIAGSLIVVMWQVKSIAAGIVGGTALQGAGAYVAGMVRSANSAANRAIDNNRSNDRVNRQTNALSKGK